MRPSVPDVHITDSQDAEFAAYRALPSQAVVGLVLALLSPIAVLDPFFWAVPATGAFFSVWALRRIHRDPAALTGRKLAWFGLAVSVAVLVAVPSHWLNNRRLLRIEARDITSAWIRYVTHDEPQKAHHLTTPAQKRQPLDDQLWNYYRNEPKSRQALEGYVQIPLVRTLLALGPKASVRFYETTEQVHEGPNDMVIDVYAVTYEDEGEKKSMLVEVPALRTLVDGKANWRILETKLVSKPNP
jgi:hypothetical protein